MIMRFMLLRRLVISALLAVSLTASSCQQGIEPAGSQKQAEPRGERVVGTRGGSLTYRVISPPKTFNYLMASDVDSLLVSFLLIGGRLVELDHDTQRYVPGVAEAWKLAGDERTLELTLRDGVRFSDGHPLTADDVLFTFRAIYDERMASPVFRDAMSIGGRRIDVFVVDANHLRLVFPEPVAVPESYLSNVAVLPRHALGEDLNQGTLREAYNMASDPRRVVTAGAFMVQSVSPGNRVTLERNPHYWKRDQAGTPLPYLDSLVIDVVGDPNSAFTRLEQNTLDIVDRIRPTDYAALYKREGAVRAFDLGPGLTTDHLWFNLNEVGRGGDPKVDSVKRAWFGDLRFRRAVSHLIDRDSIASATLQGLATPLHGFVSPGNRAWAANDLPRIDYDLERGRTLLGEAGFIARGTPDAPELYDAKGNRIEFTLLVPVESQARTMMAAVIQEDLTRVGIRMQVAPVENGELIRRTVQSYDYDAVLSGVSVTEPDPSSYVNFLLSNSPLHQWHPKQAKPASDWEARIDEMLTAQARETDTERRRAVFRDIQLILAEQLPVIPISARHVTTAANVRVGNNRPSMLFPHSLWNAEELFVR
ncbi:MAG: ABC transporter substrate-binding protein [Pyrinomonadaceae bacterium]|nr:ABC transporter substrate-binding protein [Pyrinomonadaceae bacterium]